MLNKQAVYFKKNPVVYDRNMVDANYWKYQLEKITNGEVTSADAAKDTISEYRQWFDGMKTAAVEAGITGATAIDKIKQSIKKFGSWNIMTFAITKIKRGLIDIVKNVKELDAAMTELRKVTDETSGRYESFVKEAAASAKQLGTTLVDIVNATSTFARLGYNIDDASEYAKIATVYKNVGDSIESIDDAASSLVSTMKAFKLENISDAWGIIDLFNEVGNSFATTSGDIGEAMKRSASALVEAGNTIEQSVGLYTAAQTIVQDADVVGTALKTLSMRLRGTKDELESAGLDVDGLASSTSALRGEILALANVDIMKSATEFKSTYEMLQDLSKVWDKLEETSRARVLELVAGKRMASTVAAIINNFDIAEKVVGLDYSGSAMKENDKYLESINGRIDTLKASYEEFSQTVLDSELVKFVVDAGNTVINVFNKLFSAEAELGNIASGLNGIAKAAESLSPALDSVSKVKLWGILPTIIPVITAVSNILDKNSDGGYVGVKRTGTSLKIGGTGRYSKEMSSLSEKDIVGFLGLGSYKQAAEYLEKNKDKFNGWFEKILVWEDKVDKDTGKVEKVFTPLFDTDPQEYRKVLKNFGDYAKEADLIARSTEHATVATDQMSEAVVKNTLKFKAFTAASKVANVVLATLKSIAVSFAIQFVINSISTLIDNFQNGMKNAVDALNDAKSSLADTKDQIEETQSELDTVRSKISDIQNLGTLSITDSSDLKNLQKQNAELTVQLAMLKERQKIEEETLNDAERKVWNLFTGSNVFSKTYDTFAYDKNASSYDKQVANAEASAKGYVDWAKEAYPKIQAEIAEYASKAEDGILTAKEKTRWNWLKNKEQKIRENLMQFYSDIEDLDYAPAKAYRNSIAFLLADAQSQATIFNSIADGLTERASTQLKQLATEGKITEEALKDIFSGEVLDELLALCGGMDNLIDYLTVANSASEEVTSTLYRQAAVLETVNTNIDNIQSAYSDLVSIASEYNANGYITLDTLQKLMSMSDENLSYLSLENGQLVLNTEAIKTLTNARIEEMRVIAWNNVIARIDQIVAEKDTMEEATVAIENKTAATEEMTEATLRNYVAEKLANGATDAARASIEEAIREWAMLDALIVSGTKGVNNYTNAALGAADATKSLTDAIKDQYDELLDKEKARINAAKEVLEDRKKDLQDELDALEDQYEAEDKLLELQKAKDRYEAAKANKNTRLYTADKGWQWVSDPQELEDAKSSLDELHKEMERDEAKKAIQDQIDAIDDLIDKCDDALDILGQDWDDYIEHLNLVAEMQGLTMEQLGDQVEGFVDRAIDLIRQYSNALKEAAAAESMLGNGNGKKNTGDNDKPVEKDFWKDTKAGTIISDVIAKSKQQENWYRNNLPNSITNPFPNGVSGVSDTKIAGKIVDDIAKGKRAPLATGAKYVSSSGIYNVDDGNGPEIIARRGRYTRLEVGDGVVPADLTARLFALAKSPEEYIMPKVSGLFATLAANLIGRPGQVQQSAQQPIYIAKVEVTGVEDVDGFLDELTKIVNRKRKV